MVDNITNPVVEVQQQPKVDIKQLKKLKAADILVNAIKNHEKGIQIFHGQYFDERTGRMFGEEEIKAVIQHPDYKSIEGSFLKLEQARQASLDSNHTKGR